MRGLLRPGRGSGGREVPDQPVGPGDERLHVRAVFMAAVVLTPRQLSIQEPRVHGGHFGGAIVFLLADVPRPQQPEHRPRRDRRHVAALLVQPVGVAAFRHPVADEREPRRAQGDQHVRVHRQIPGVLAPESGRRGAVLQEIARHPVVFAGAGQVLDGLAEIAAVELGAPFTRRTHQRQGETRLESQRYQCGLAEARHALDPHLLRVHGGVGFEIVQTARRAPGPGAQRTPVVGFAGLSLVDQADNALGESGAAVGLDACGVDRGVTPTRGEQLLRGGRVLEGTAEVGKSIGHHRRAHRPRQAVPAKSAKHHEERHRPLGTRRRHHGHPQVHGDRRTSRVVHVPDQALAARGEIAHEAIRHVRHHGPGDRGHALGHTPDHFPLEVLDDFRAALPPPHLGGRHLPAALEREDFRQIGERIRLGGIIIGRIRGPGLAAGPGSQPGDPQLLHHVLMILLRRPGQRRGALPGLAGGRVRRLAQQRAGGHPQREQ